MILTMASIAPTHIVAFHTSSHGHWYRPYRRLRLQARAGQPGASGDHTAFPKCGASISLADPRGTDSEPDDREGIRGRQMVAAGRACQGRAGTTARHRDP